MLLSFTADVIVTLWLILTTLLVPNVIESGPNVYQSLGVPLQDSANYNIISRNSYLNVFCQERVAEISSKILQKQLQLY